MNNIYYIIDTSRCGGMVDTANLKFVERKLVWVQVPPSVLNGSVAEWFIASDLKSEGCKSSVGSNPTTSLNIQIQCMLFFTIQAEMVELVDTLD